MGRLEKLKRQIIEESNKRILNEQITPKDKKLNLFCMSNRSNKSFRENNLFYNQEQDLPNGVKRIFLDKKNYVPDNVFSEDDQNFVLDVTPVTLLGNKFPNEINVINPINNIVLMNYSSDSVTYFCQIDSETDQEWANYFNQF
jgi:hypothetical protein